MDTSGERKLQWNWLGKAFSHLICFTPIFLVLVVYFHETVLLEYEGQFGYGRVDDYDLPAQLMEQFMAYDSDASGCIDPYEFSFLQDHLELASFHYCLVF